MNDDQAQPPTVSPDALIALFGRLSHEIRTPLNGILGMAQLLARAELGPSEQEYVRAIRRSGEQLLELLNTLIDYSRVDLDLLHYEPKWFAPSRTLSAIAELMAPLAYEKGLEIACIDRVGEPVEILGDESRLQQILYNIVGNALKFTEHGGAVISWRVEPPAGGGALDPNRAVPATLWVDVADSGRGVPIEMRARIFEDYAQSRSDDRALGGVGLGLGISRRLVEARGGRLSVDDSPWGGARFSFNLPADLRTDPATAHRSGAAGGFRGLVGLYIRNPALLAACEGMLGEISGIATRRIDPAAAECADCQAVLADDRLLEGRLTALRAAKAPILVAVAPERRANIAAYRAEGAAGYLIKPIRLSSLRERLDALAAPPAGPSGESANVEDDRIEDIAGAGLRALIVDDNPINTLLARRLFEQYGFTVETAADGLAALAAASAADFDVIALDLRMPGLTGWDTARRLRAAGKRNAQTPIVAISAHVDADVTRQCYDAGIDAIVAKPLDAGQLQLALLRLRRHPRAAAM